MFLSRFLGPVAALTALGFAGVAATGSSASPPAAQPIVESNDPVAEAVGGDVGTTVFPALLNVRLVRAEGALERLIAAVDTHSPTAAAELNTTTYNAGRAWKGAKYIVKTTPPPVTGDAVNYVATGVPNASPDQGAIAALGLQHDIITNLIGLLGTADPALRPAMSTAVTDLITARNSEIAYIHSVAPPPVAGQDRVEGHASGAPVAADFNTLMPDVTTLVADEIKQIQGTKPVDGAAALMFSSWAAKDLKTVTTLNSFWPPAPADD